MSAQFDALLLEVATLLAASAVLCGVVGYVSTRDLRASLPLTLDLLLAAGLLRLTVLDTWTAISAAAGVVAVRRLVTLGLAAGKGSSAGPGISATVSGTADNTRPPSG